MYAATVLSILDVKLTLDYKIIPGDSHSRMLILYSTICSNHKHEYLKLDQQIFIRINTIVQHQCCYFVAQKKKEKKKEKKTKQRRP